MCEADPLTHTLCCELIVRNVDLISEFEPNPFTGLVIIVRQTDHEGSEVISGVLLNIRWQAVNEVASCLMVELDVFAARVH